ncbi:hypothetical protein [Methylobacterium sp. E-046]|uniref:hypothetical protein n=1 Tax=Methylobacterium sp. E-046 TaxID=2836576 RepID=UPI001FBAEA1E|nr:hypothetical protein [Methylobacterium sp. E-046]MCJ2103009.1 hypothetical protein [Methylobacterium sp. E-046]
MDNAAYEAARSRLGQIAAALGIPVTTFLAPPRAPITAAAAAEQEEELLQLFRKIGDAEMRERLLVYMRAVVGKTAA